MHFRFLAITLVTVLLAGCAATTPQNPNASAPLANGTSSTPPKAAETPDPSACKPEGQLTNEAAADLLASISRYAPLDRLTGQARQIAAGWRLLGEQGWPVHTLEYVWTGRAWRSIKISPGQAGSHAVALTYVNGTVTDWTATWHFEVVCESGQWLVARSGQWETFEPPLVEFPGQRGALTDEFARNLAFEALGSQGPWLMQVATGTELADGRNEMLRYAQGHTMRYTTPWPGTGDRMKVTAESESQAVGEWTDEAGKPTGESVRFVREAGLWKVENHTIQGQWLDSNLTWLGVPLGAARQEMTLFTLELGIDRSKVEAFLGTPDKTQQTADGTILHYDLRQIDVQLDKTGQVAAVSGRTGATNTGIPVGAPAAMVSMVYGPADDYTYSSRNEQTLRFEVRDGRVEQIVLTQAK